jgi:hypothetical protein
MPARVGGASAEPSVETRPRLAGRSRRPFRAGGALAALSLAWLSACQTLGLGSGGKDEASSVTKAALQCPRVATPADTADLVRFRTPESRDLTELVVSARITSLSGTCTLVSRNSAVQVTVAMGAEAMRGPAAPGRTVEVPYFVAVSAPNEEVLDKAVYTLAVEFPENVQRARMRGEEIRLLLPVTPERPAASYTVHVGFQLTEQELALNRARLARR